MDDRIISFENAYIDENNQIWISSMYYNSLFCFDLRTEKLEWKGCFPNERMYGRWLYSSITAIENLLFFTPYVAREVCAYDRRLGVFTKYEIENGSVDFQKYCATVNWKNKLYFFGALNPLVSCLNLNTMKMHSDSSLIESLKKYDITESGWWINRNAIVIGNICYLSSRRCSIIIEFNLEDGRYVFHELDKIKGGVTSICLFCDEIIIISSEGDIVGWNYKTHAERQYEYNGTRYKNSWSYNICNDKELILFPMKGIESVSIFFESEECKKSSQQYEYCDSELSIVEREIYVDQKISWVGKSSFGIVYFSNMNRSLYFEKEGKWKKLQLMVSDGDYEKINREKIFNCYQNNSELLIEDKSRNLEEFILWIRSQ